MWDIPVLSHNEARRLVAMQEMLARHSWLLPTPNGLLYLEKPPLFYWIRGFAAMLTEGCSHGCCDCFCHSARWASSGCYSGAWDFGRVVGVAHRLK
jgi:hypothetical protein